MVGIDVVTDPIDCHSAQFPFMVELSSGFGTLGVLFISYCTEHFGPELEKWCVESYGWHYKFYFAQESDALAFYLRWS